MTILKDKSVVKSWTFWGALIVSLVEAAKQAGLLDPGFASSLAQIVQTAGGFLAAMGLRRAVSNG